MGLLKWKTTADKQRNKNNKKTQIKPQAEEEKRGIRGFVNVVSGDKVWQMF